MSVSLTRQLVVDNVHLSFGGIQALAGVSLSVSRGELVAIIGPNGAGKSSLLNTISGLYVPRHGRIEFEGTSILGGKPHQIARLGVARTFQNLGLFASLSVLGRAMLAVRDREVAASSIGIDVARVKLAAFGLSAFYAGSAGALLAHLGRSVNFEQFQLDLSIQYLAMIVIGGLGTVRGSLLGAAFITLLPIVLRVVVAPVESLLPGSTSGLVSSLQLVLFGVVIVAFMLLQPRGLASLRVDLLAWVRRGLYVGPASVRRATSAAR